MIDVSTSIQASDDVNDDEVRKKNQIISFSKIEAPEVIGEEKKKEFKPFVEFSSDEKDPKNSQTFKLLVTKKEFEDILRKNYLDKVNSRYGRFSVCKIKLKDNEEIKIGDSEIREQHFIDIKDAKNDIRFFIDAEAYENLKEYKDTLYDKFKAYLNSQTSSDINGITQQINGFKSLGDITSAGSVLSTGAANTVAKKLDLDSEEKIAKKAQELTELYINKRFARGKMSTETMKSPPEDGSEEKKFGFFKVVRNQKRPKDIRVYKSEKPTKLKILNVTVGNNEIMQFETCDAGEIKSARHFMRTNQYAAFQRVNDPKDFSKESRGTSIRIFKEKTETEKKMMERFKIKVGVDSEESFLKSKKEVVFVENVIELGNGDNDSINIGNNVKIIRDNGKLTIKYGDNKLYRSLSLLSNYHGGFFSNNKPEKVGDRGFNLKAHSSIIEKITPEPSCLKSGKTKHHSVIFKILDKKDNSFSYVELTKKGSLTSPSKSTYTAKILEKRFEEKFDPSPAAHDVGRG